MSTGLGINSGGSSLVRSCCNNAEPVSDFFSAAGAACGLEKEKLGSPAAESFAVVVLDPNVKPGVDWGSEVEPKVKPGLGAGEAAEGVPKVNLKPVAEVVVVAVVVVAVSVAVFWGDPNLKPVSDAAACAPNLKPPAGAAVVLLSS